VPGDWIWLLHIHVCMLHVCMLIVLTNTNWELLLTYILRRESFLSVLKHVVCCNFPPTQNVGWQQIIIYLLTFLSIIFIIVVVLSSWDQLKEHSTLLIGPWRTLQMLHVYGDLGLQEVRLFACFSWALKWRENLNVIHTGRRSLQMKYALQVGKTKEKHTRFACPCR